MKILRLLAKIQGFQRGEGLGQDVLAKSWDVLVTGM